jgi:hypothetical protein
MIGTLNVMGTMFSERPFYNFCPFKTINNIFKTGCCSNENSTPLRAPAARAQRPLSNYDVERMSNLLWQIRREREEQQQDDVKDRRVRRNMERGGNGWVNAGPNYGQFVDGEGDEENGMDDEVYEGY